MRASNQATSAARLGVWLPALAAAALITMLVTAPSPAATSGTVVGATVPSATTLIPTCATGSPATTFGNVLPGSNVVTSADCSIQFGSSNNTAVLRVFQSDKNGDAMFSQPFGPQAYDWQWEIAGGPAGELSKQSELVEDGNGDVYMVGWEVPGETLIARFDNGGALDATFSGGDGSNGYHKVAATNPETSVAIDSWPNGSVIVAMHDPAGDGGVRIVKLLASGLGDPSFGSAGSTTLDLCNPNGAPNAELYDEIIATEDGGAWLAGTCEVGAGDHQWIVAKLRPNGTPDPTFAGDGTWEWNPDAAVIEDVVGLDVDSTGVYVGGHVMAGGEFAAASAHISLTGVADTAYDGGAGNLLGGNGFVAYVLTPGLLHLVKGYAVDPSGRAFLAMAQSDGSEANTSTVVLRLTATGARDTAFDGDGFRVQDVGAGIADIPAAIHTMGDGSALVVGKVGNAAADEDTYVVRLTAGGQPDANFDPDGVLTVEYNGGQDNRATDLDLGLHGRFIVTQDATWSPGDGYMQAFVLAADAIPQYSNLGAGGDRDWASDPAGTSMFAMCIRQLGGTAAIDQFAEDVGNNCTATDADQWYAVPASTGTTARAATLGANLTTGTVALRFGFRPAGDRRAGAYYAPISFEVLAPSTL